LQGNPRPGAGAATVVGPVRGKTSLPTTAPSARVA
jgi:hypothetical protein